MLIPTVLPTSKLLLSCHKPRDMLVPTSPHNWTAGPPGCGTGNVVMVDRPHIHMLILHWSKHHCHRGTYHSRKLHHTTTLPSIYVAVAEPLPRQYCYENKRNLSSFQKHKTPSTKHTLQLCPVSYRRVGGG